MEVKPIWVGGAPEVPDGASPGPDAPLRERVIAAMQTVFDPEIAVNIYDLGLVYALNIDARGEVAVEMTLTAPTCPVAGSLPGQVERAIRAVDGVENARVSLVWDPPWCQARMSDTAKLTLGLL